MTNDMLGFLATQTERKITEFVIELARMGYPKCNSVDAQNEAAITIGYNSVDEFLDDLCDRDMEFLQDEMARRLTR